MKALQVHLLSAVVLSIFFLSISPALSQTDKILPVLPDNWYGKSAALIVGVGDYSGQWTARQMAVENAGKMAEAFREQGFAVNVLLNEKATKPQIAQVLYNEILPTLTEKDRFVLYFTGHGRTKTIGKDSRGYLVPFGGKRTADQDDWSSYVAVTEIYDMVFNRCKARHVLLIFDTTVGGLDTTPFKVNLQQDVDKILTKKGRAVLATGSPGQKFVDGVFPVVFTEGLNGLADGDDDNLVSLSELYNYVETHTSAFSRQHLTIGRVSGNGEMVFLRGMQKSTGENIVSYSGEGTAIPFLENDPNAIRKSAGGRYRINECGSIVDTQTGLEWYAGPDRDINFIDANYWVSRLEVCGGTWRLPTLTELSKLYSPTSKAGYFKVRMHPTFNAIGRGLALWSAETSDSIHVWGFVYSEGIRYNFPRNNSGMMRAFAVRDLK